MTIICSGAPVYNYNFNSPILIKPLVFIGIDYEFSPLAMVLEDTRFPQTLINPKTKRKIKKKRPVFVIYSMPDYIFHEVNFPFTFPQLKKYIVIN